MMMFVKADHAGDKLTHHSHTGILLYVNRAPIIWYSKKQNTVESSTFGSEMVALRIGMEMIKGLQYKLRMMGIPIDRLTLVFCDNKSVVTNASVPDSTLNKKHLGICYHAVHEAVTARIMRVCHIDGKKNLADCLTKMLMAAVKQPHIEKILY